MKMRSSGTVSTFLGYPYYTRLIFLHHKIADSVLRVPLHPHPRKKSTELADRKWVWVLRFSYQISDRRWTGCKALLEEHSNVCALDVSPPTSNQLDLFLLKKLRP